LEIHYTANSFVAPRKVRFEYRLVGYDKQWRSADWSQRTAVYTNLRPGRYTFRVRACNNHDCWNTVGAQFAFALQPKFTQTLWFPAICATGLFALSALLASRRLRGQRRILRLEQATALATERTRIARDLHDDLGTALTALALELDVIRRKRAHEPHTEPLSDTARRARDLAERMREVVWAINPHCDTVPNLALFLEDQAARFLENAGIRCRLEFPEHVPSLALSAQVRHQLILSIRESLSNIVRHSAASEVVLRLLLANGAIGIEIADNGSGFKVPETFPPGHGLANLRARLASVGGTFKLDSTPGQGTRACFSVPVPNSTTQEPAA
jgi:signal transduction histidine kinase